VIVRIYIVIVVVEWAGVTIQHTNWDQLPRSDIKIGSGTTFRYANSLGVGSMRGLLN